MDIENVQSNKTISNKALLSINPLVDSAAILRVRGSLFQSALLHDQIFPILLPSIDYVIKLLLKREH